MINMNNNNEEKKLLVLVTGVTGKQGGAVARELLNRNHRVRGFTRNPDSERALEVKNLGVELVRGTFDEPSTIEKALVGVDAAFLMGTPFRFGVEKETEHGILFVKIAKKQKIKHLLYTSVGSAHKKTRIPHFESKFKVEEYIRKINIPYTIIRPVFFMENFIAPFRLPKLKIGIISAPMPKDRKLAMISIRDIGRFAAHILERREKFLGKEIDIASDDISGEESAKIFSQILNREFKYIEQNYEDIAVFGEDMVLMYKWFNKIGYNIDIDELNKLYPEIGWKKLEDWVREQDWTIFETLIESPST